MYVNETSLLSCEHGQHVSECACVHLYQEEWTLFLERVHEETQVMKDTIDRTMSYDLSLVSVWFSPFPQVFFNIRQRRTPAGHQTVGSSCADRQANTRTFSSKQQAKLCIINHKTMSRVEG